MSGDNDAVLFGAVGGPKWDDPNATVRPEQGLLDIRAHMGVFANIRPVKVYPWLADASPLKARCSGRRGHGGGARAHRRPLLRRAARDAARPPGGVIAEDTMRYTEGEIERVLRVGFELARGRRKKLTSVDKANVLECSRLWRTVATRLGEEYPDVELEHVLVDACAMQLISSPSRFDVIVAENTFGDILTDEASVLAASMGLAALGQPRRRSGGWPALRWHVRTHPRHRARHRWQGHRQPHRLHPQHGHDAPLLPRPDRGSRRGGAGR